MTFKFEKTSVVQLADNNGNIVAANGLLVESEGLCAIYNLLEECFKFVCTDYSELGHILATQHLQMKKLTGDERFCTKCGKLMHEGFYFESDGTMYCSENCLLKVISWNEYLAIHNNGNGDAYWTDWYDC